MLGDIRYALRIAVKQRGFTLLVVLTMALGIGAATATFSIVDTVLLRPLPYKNADRLMSVFMTGPSQRSNPALSKIWDQLGPTLSQFDELKKRQTVFEDLAILRNVGAPIETGGRRQIRLGVVSANFFAMLGVQSPLGRLFSADDDRPEAVRTAVLSHEIWYSAFGGDAGILGKTITIREARVVNPYVVIGVLSPGFEFADYGPEPNPTPDIWIPSEITNQPDNLFGLIATLKKGVSVSDGERETQTILDSTLSDDLRPFLER